MAPSNSSCRHMVAIWPFWNCLPEIKWLGHWANFEHYLAYIWSFSYLRIWTLLELQQLWTNLSFLIFLSWQPWAAITYDPAYCHLLLRSSFLFITYWMDIMWVIRDSIEQKRFEANKKSFTFAFNSFVQIKDLDCVFFIFTVFWWRKRNKKMEPIL